MLRSTRRRYTLKERDALAVVTHVMQDGWDTGDALRFVFRMYEDALPNALTVLFDCLGGIQMARGGRTNGKVEPSSWTRFVDISLAGVTREEIEDEFGDPQALADAVDGLLLSGYRLGFSYVEAKHAFVVSLTCRNDGLPNDGCTVTAFAGDWVEAARVVLYKHFVLAKEDWSALSGGTDASSFG